MSRSDKWPTALVTNAGTYRKVYENLATGCCVVRFQSEGYLPRYLVGPDDLTQPMKWTQCPTWPEAYLCLTGLPWIPLRLETIYGPQT